MVGVVYVLEVVQIGLTSKDSFATYAAKWGDVIHADEVKTLWFSIPILTGISKCGFFSCAAYSFSFRILVGCIVQLFYVQRVFLLGRNYWLTSSIITASVVDTMLLQQSSLTPYMDVDSDIVTVSCI